MLCYVMLCYVMLCINFITDQNSEEHIRSCLQQEKLSTKASKTKSVSEEAFFRHGGILF